MTGLACLVTQASAEFDNVPFTIYNFDTFPELDVNFVCQVNIINRAITGCTVLDAAVDTEFSEGSSDWRGACTRKMNAWNRDPANTQANVVVKQPNGGATSFGCNIKVCDGNNQADYGIASSDNGRRTAVVMSNYYCGRPSAGMVVATGSDAASDLTALTTGNAALLERGVVSIFSTPDFNTATVATLCALKVDASAVCWGGQDVSALTLTNVTKFSATRLAIATLNGDGTVEAAGDVTLGGSIAAAGATAIAGAASGNTRDIVCNPNGECIGILNDGTPV